MARRCGSPRPRASPCCSCDSPSTSCSSTGPAASSARCPACGRGCRRSPRAARRSSSGSVRGRSPRAARKRATTSSSKMAAGGLAALRDVLVPPRCAGCSAPGSWYCVACRDGSDPIVTRAGAVVLTAAGAFEGPLREAIHRLKYGNEPGLAAELGALIAGRIVADLAVGIRLDAVVPVRAHPRRERERGYDQATALASVAAGLAGVPVRPAIHRLRSGPAQATLGQLERRANVKGAFAGIAGSLRGLQVGLIDDVATTRATLPDPAAAPRAL